MLLLEIDHTTALARCCKYLYQVLKTTIMFLLAYWAKFSSAIIFYALGEPDKIPLVSSAIILSLGEHDKIPSRVSLWCEQPTFPTNRFDTFPPDGEDAWLFWMRLVLLTNNKYAHVQLRGRKKRSASIADTAGGFR